MLNVVGPLPIRTLLFLNERGHKAVLAKPTAYWQVRRDWDEGAFAYRGGGRIFTNPSNWALQGLPQPDGNPFSNRRTVLDAACNSPSGFSERQRRLADHSIARAQMLPSGALTWVYDYESQANDVLFMPPFNSAFSQAANLHLLLYAHCQTHDARYLDAARRAGDALIAPIREGGLTNDGAGETWFEETPNADGLNPYILNAHIYAINVLFLLGEVTRDQRYADAAQRGTASLERLLPKFDAGYWTRYDLRPRYFEMYLEVQRPPGVAIRRVELWKRGSRERAAAWSLCEDGCDRELEETRAGDSYRFTAVIEALRFYRPSVGDELELSIDHVGAQPPRVFSTGIRPGLAELAEIATLIGPPGRLTAQLGVREFGWHQPGEEYIRYHALLLADLYRRQANPLFFVSAIRFANYHRVYDNEKARPDRRRPRQFSLEPAELRNERQDAMIAACFREEDALRIDLAAAMARLPQCTADPGERGALLRRMGFLVRPGAVPLVSDGAASYRIHDFARVE